MRLTSHRAIGRSRPTTTRVSVVALTVALALTLVGCGSSSGSDASDTKADDAGKTTTTAAKTGTTKPGGSDTSKPDGSTTTTIKIDPSLSIDAAGTKVLADVDTSTFCSGVEGFAGLFQALFNGFGSDAERPKATPAEEAAFNQAVQSWAAEVLDVAPAEIKDDFAVFAKDPIGEKAEPTPAEQSASDHVGTYVQANCNIPSN